MRKLAKLYSRIGHSLAKYLKKVLTTPRLLIITLLATTITITVTSVIVVKISQSSCENVAAQAHKSITFAGGPQDIESAYEKLGPHSHVCSKNNTADKLQQLQLYHDRAVSAYMLGHTDEAKKNAEAGLAIAQQLPTKEGSLKSNAELIKELGYIKEGTY